MKRPDSVDHFACKRSLKSSHSECNFCHSQVTLLFDRCRGIFASSDQSQSQVLLLHKRAQLFNRSCLRVQLQPKKFFHLTKTQGELEGLSFPWPWSLCGLESRRPTTTLAMTLQCRFPPGRRMRSRSFRYGISCCKWWTLLLIQARLHWCYNGLASLCECWSGLRLERRTLRQTCPA